MDCKFLYPVDTDQFANIRERGKVYVDKTDLMYDLVRKYDYVFLSRPRRFGKSLLCSTLDAYFSGRKELFEGLKIMELEREWKKYPVLRFDMSILKDLSVEEARVKLGNAISKYEIVYGKDAAEVTPGDRFIGLIRRAYAVTGEKAVVIIDEYDAPVMRLLYDNERLAAMRSMLREFYQTLKAEGAFLRFVFLTGVTKFSQLSIFSELNNLKNISMLVEYSGICGITQSELDDFMLPHVEDFAERLRITVAEAYALLKKQYDGYHFCEDSQDVYAPFSLLNALNDGKLGQYWFSGATPSALIGHLKHFPISKPMEYDGVVADMDEFDISCESASTPMPLLYQSGYLSIDSFEKQTNSFVLHFPNNEVRTGMIKCLMPLVLEREPSDTTGLIREMTRSVYNGDLSSALLHLRSYIAGIPYDIITREEWDDRNKRESFFKLLLYMAFSMLNANVDCEHKCIPGRADVVIQTQADVFLLELKVDGTVEEALAQINDNGYAVPWSADGRRVTKCGVVLSSEKRNIVHWKSIDVNGLPLDEQLF